MDAMLAEAAASPIGNAIEPKPATAADLPNVCMGAAFFASFAITRLGMRGLEQSESEKLGNALVRVMNAYNLTIADERVASVVDLGACCCMLMVPRIMEDIARRKAAKASPTQAAANASGR